MWKTKLDTRQLSFEGPMHGDQLFWVLCLKYDNVSQRDIACRGKLNLPEFVAVTVCKHKVWQLFHDSLGCGIHEVERTAVIWLDELVFGGEPESGALARAS